MKDPSPAAIAFATPFFQLERNRMQLARAVDRLIEAEQKRCEQAVYEESRHWPADNNPGSAFVNILKRIRGTYDR